MTETSEQSGNLEVAMQHAARLLEHEPTLAAEQAQEILNAIPNHPPAVLLKGVAMHRAGDSDGGLKMLEELLETQANWSAAHYEYGVMLGNVGRGDKAIDELREAVRLKPDHPDAWRVLADHLRAVGDNEAGDAAYARHIQCSASDPVMQQAAGAMIKNDVAVAERLLKRRLNDAPTDVAAIRMLAEVAIRCGRDVEAKNLIERCLELAPGFTAARYVLGVLLHRANSSAAAMAELEVCLTEEPNNPSFRNLAAVVLSRVGEYERSSKMYKQLLDEYPDNSKVWLSYGHVLKTEGRPDDCIGAYRQSVTLDPAFGEAYWSLANMKTFKFSDADLAEMHSQLGGAELSDSNRLQFHFALGKAYEDAGEYESSFEHYAAGNRIYRAGHSYDADVNTRRATRLKNAFSGDFFSRRARAGCAAPDPIFIIGMPRAGSTLLEQILSCHSAVEGTMELPDVMTIVKELSQQAESDEVVAYTDVLASKSERELRELGELYIERTRIQRKTDAPFFIDKLPNNFIHVGLIHLILPNAKIIDARRHPLGCCFSNFKQHYAVGQVFSYDLEDIGGFYSDYVDLMAHFDEILPGRIHRVFYEDTVDHTEREVRRLLDYCGLPFESECLRFFESRRPVRTASSEQVRQPIYKEGVEQWRNFEPWLEPLKGALGPVLEQYPAVPDFSA